MGKTSNAVLCPVLGTAVKKRGMYELKHDNENDQKDLATQSETIEFAQLQEEEDRIVVLKDVKILAKKEEIFFLHA